MNFTSWFAPSLSRRLVLAVLSALALAWSVLLIDQYLEARALEHDNPALQHSLDNMQDMLTGVEDVQVAREIVVALDRAISASLRRAGDDYLVLVELRDLSDGRLVFQTEPRLTLTDAGQGLSERQAMGRELHVAVRNTKRWQMAVAQSRLPDSLIVSGFLGETTRYVLLAAPFVLLPVWLAVWLGLRPLRNLAAQIRRRSPGDAAPLGQISPHVEVRVLVDAFDGLLSRLSAAMARERAFVQDAAHELRTPLAVLAAQVHAASLATSAQDRELAFAELQCAVQRAAHLVQQLLDLAQIEGMDRTAHSHNLPRRLREILSEFAPRALARDTQLELEAPEHLERVVDSAALQMIVGNLVDNAVRYCPPGSRVWVRLDEPSEGWRVCVSDNGPGIPEAERARVFERFYRGSHLDVPGSGLGLAIAAAAAHRMGAELTLMPATEADGSCFCLRVPAPSHGAQGLPRASGSDRRQDLTVAVKP